MHEGGYRRAFTAVWNRRPKSKLDQGVDVPIALRGRMFDLRSQGPPGPPATCKPLILDEADHMLDSGFIRDIRDVIKHLPRNQTLFFSATVDTEIKGPGVFHRAQSYPYADLA